MAEQQGVLKNPFYEPYHIPIQTSGDVVMFLTFLVKKLEQKGIITSSDSLFLEFEYHLECNGSLDGEVKISEYNLEL